MKRKIKAGTTGHIARVFIQNTSSTTGAGLTGLAFNSAGLTAYYSRVGAATATAITLVTATAGTFASGGFVELDATNMPGIYELHIPNAALASGANGVHLMLKGATNMVPVPIEIELDAVDYQDAVRLGLTALPAANAGASGGIITEGTGTAQIAVTGGAVNTVGQVQSGVTVTTNNDKAGYGLSAAAVQSIWDALTSALTAVGSIGKLLVDNINAAIGSRLATVSYTAPLDSTATQAAAAAALTAYDPLTRTEATSDKDEILTSLTAAKGATFDGTTDSLEAIRNRGDAAWATGAGGTTNITTSTTVIEAG